MAESLETGADHGAHDHTPRSVRPAVAAMLLWAAAGCAADTPSNPPVFVQDSAGVTIVTSDLAQHSAACSVSPEPDVSIGVAEGAPEYQLYRVFGSRQLSDGRIALVDQGSQQLRFYDSRGTFLNAVGGRGGGPGEFQNAFHLWVLPGDSVWVGDYAPWEFEVFAPDGKWLRNVRADPPYTNSPMVLAMLDDGSSVLAEAFYDAPTGRFQPQVLTVLLHGADGRLVDTVAALPNGTRGRFEEWPMFIAAPFFESTARATAAGSRIVLAHTSTPELSILEVDPAGTPQLERLVRWTAQPQRVTAADVDEERRRIADEYADVSPEWRSQLLDPQVYEGRPAAETFPVFSSVSIGRDGRI